MSKNNNLKMTELISKQQINAFVDQLLNDQNVNIKYLPDFVEKQIYRNVFSILVGVIDNVIKSAHINIIGHRINLTLEPDLDLSSTDSSDE